MTAPPITHDTASYSTRTCRCGHEMLRLIARANASWVCPSCGRRAR